eukprot:gene22099-biopygen4195
MEPIYNGYGGGTRRGVQCTTGMPCIGDLISNRGSKMPFPFLFGAGMAALKSNLPQYIGGAMMGLGYTSGAYTGYGVSNTVDPIGIHRSEILVTAAIDDMDAILDSQDTDVDPITTDGDITNGH